MKDDRIATLKQFLTKIPKDKIKEVCIDIKESLRKVVEALFPKAKVVADPFHVIADSNKRMDEARRIEQDVNHRRKIKIPKKIFLIGGEKLGEGETTKVNRLLEKYPSLRGFYWAKEKIRELYRLFKVMPKLLGNYMTFTSTKSMHMYTTVLVARQRLKILPERSLLRLGAPSVDMNGGISHSRLGYFVSPAIRLSTITVARRKLCR